MSIISSFNKQFISVSCIKCVNILCCLSVINFYFVNRHEEHLCLGGAEVVTVTDLPGLVYPDLADPYHGERPCCFSRDGRHVATGSEDGRLQVWDLTGAQVYSLYM